MPVVKMLAPSEEPKHGFIAEAKDKDNPEEKVELEKKHDNDITDTQDKSEVAPEKTEVVKEEEGESEEKNVIEEDNAIDLSSSPEVPQKVAFKEDSEQEDSVKNGAIDKAEIETNWDELLIEIVKEEETDRKEVEVVTKAEPEVTSEGSVANILINLEISKTPEPDEASEGIVKASFVDCCNDDNDDDPIEEQSDDDDEENEEEQPNSDKKEVEEEDENEIVEVFQMGDLNASNPELQKIREEQVRKWLKFEEENPTTPRDENGHGQEDLEGEICEGEDGINRKVRFLTDTEGNLLISVFMSKLVHIIFFFLNIVSGGFHNFRSQFAQAQSQSRPLQHRHLPLSSSHGKETIETVIDLETDLTESLNLFNNSNPANNENSEENSLTNNSNHPSLVISPPSLDSQMNLEEDPKIEMIHATDLNLEKEPDIVLLAQAFLKEPPKEKPPAPPIDDIDNDIDEGCNSSDETLSVSSCNSMIEILPGNSNGKTDCNNNSIEEMNNKQNAENNKTVLASEIEIRSESMEIREFEKMEEKLLQEIENHNVIINNNPLEIILHENKHVDEEDDKAEAGDNDNNNDSDNDSSQPGSFIVHDIEEFEKQELEPLQEPAPCNDIIKTPNVDENNNVVEESVEPPPDVMNDQDQEQQDSTNDQELSREQEPEMPELQMPQQSTFFSDGDADMDGEEDRFISAVSEQLPSVKIPEQNESQTEASAVSKLEEDEQEEQQMVSLCIQEEHISSVALTIAKWESMSKAQSTENLSSTSTPLPHLPVTKCSSSPCPKLVKSLASAIEQVKPVPVVPLNPLPISSPVQHQSKTNGNGEEKANREESNTINNNNHSNNSNNNDSKIVSVAVNNALNTSNHQPVEPLIVSKAPGWNCWGNKIKDPKPLDSNGSSQDPDEIIYAQPNHQAGSTMTSIANPSNILKQYPKPLSKGEIVMWLKEGEIHRAGLLLNYGQTHHHAPVLTTPHTIMPVLVSWFFGLISRHQAEKYLHGQPPGTFLVRISTRIWGYTLSYQGANGRTKHFLISAVNPAVPATLQTNLEAALPPQTGKQQRMSPFVPQGRYAFIGTNMTPYGTLISLIRHHSHAPITKLGGEKLLNPCPGGPQVAGLEHLFK